MMIVLGKSRDVAQLGEVAHGTCSGFVVKRSDVELLPTVPNVRRPVPRPSHLSLSCLPSHGPHQPPWLAHNQQQEECLGPWSIACLPGPPPPEALQLRGHSAVVVIISASLFRCASCPCDCASTAAKATPESISARYVCNDSAFVFLASASNKMSAPFLKAFLLKDVLLQFVEPL